jgi:deazaflavin-dependent oxidoreductase (nitroreductase family)
MSASHQTVGNTSPGRKNRTMFRILTGIHIFLYRLSGGKIGGGSGKISFLLLNTTGRKTGKKRTTPLLYMRDGDRLVLVASYGGSPTHPLWLLNLRAKPQAEVEIGRQKLAMEAREADAEERNRLWPLLVELYAGYDKYQQKTTRQIPLVILSPRS